MALRYVSVCMPNNSLADPWYVDTQAQTPLNTRTVQTQLLHHWQWHWCCALLTVHDNREYNHWTTHCATAAATTTPRTSASHPVCWQPSSSTISQLVHVPASIRRCYQLHPNRLHGDEIKASLNPVVQSLNITTNTQHRSVQTDHNSW